MRQNLCLLSAFILFSFSLLAQQIKYELRMEKPQNHYFQVEMHLTDFNEKELLVKMPVWAPGSYLVREFAKNVDMVKAYDENGKSLPIAKKTKNSWAVSKGKAKKVVVKYEVYAFELSVRTSFLDLTHGFVSGSGIFMYVDGHKERKGRLSIFPNKVFGTITTALPKAGESLQRDGSRDFEFSNYDQLVDCPIEIGNQEPI